MASRKAGVRSHACVHLMDRLMERQLDPRPARCFASAMRGARHRRASQRADRAIVGDGQASRASRSRTAR